MFVMTLPYSDAIFVCVYPRECTEAFLDGHRRAFSFFGGVPKRISYDNSRIAVKRIMCGRQRELTDAFLRLQSHYLFAHHFCLVRRANEKGHVENLVGYAMGRGTTDTIQFPGASSQDVLTGILREGAQRLLAQAIESEVDVHIEAHKERRDAEGHRLIVRNGYKDERELQTGLGQVKIRQPRINDRPVWMITASGCVLRVRSFRLICGGRGALRN